MANHGQGAGNSKRGPIFDRQSSAAKCRNQINLIVREICSYTGPYYISIKKMFSFFFARKLHLKLVTLTIN
jgi:hypothetical protein